MPQVVKLTIYGIRVLKFFHRKPDQWRSGSEISKALQIINGTLYPLLFRFEKAGLLKSKWEAGTPKKLKRPLKRQYRLTALGKKRFLFESEKLKR